MPTDESGLSLDIVKLLTGYFLDKLTEAEHDTLDAWVSASDTNCTIFEELVDIAFRPSSPHPDFLDY